MKTKRAVKLTTHKMSVSQWASVLDNPRQRDTESRAEKSRHLMTPEPTHSQVSAAQTPNGKMYKLDGHTRAYIWKEKPEIAPPHVIVQVYHVKDIDEVKRLYSFFDSKRAVESAADAVYGGMRECGIVPQSGFVKSARFAQAMVDGYRYICGEELPGMTHYDRVRFFRDHIVSLDSFVGATKKMCSPATCCYLLAYHKHGDVVNEFFKAVVKNGGKKNGRYKDAVEWFSESMDEYVRSARGKGPVYFAYVGIGLRCVEMWLKNKTTMVTRIGASLDPSRYCTEGIANGG